MEENSLKEKSKSDMIFTKKSSKYEFVILLSHTVSVHDAIDVINQIKEKDISLKFDKNSEYWGMRMLAYPVKKQTLARYYFIQCELTYDSINEIEAAFKYNKNILRYIFIKVKNFRTEKTHITQNIRKDIDMGISSMEENYNFFEKKYQN